MKSPSSKLIRSTRLSLGLTQTQAAVLIFKKLRTWQHWETGDRNMDPIFWQSFLDKSKKKTV